MPSATSRSPDFVNPFRPGAGHPPPYLAGRKQEQVEFGRMLEQRPVLANLVLTGLRGTGKTVLLETFKPLAVASGWLWAGTDLSESASVTEETIAIRILADLAPLVTSVVIDRVESRRIGFGSDTEIRPVHLDYDVLKAVFDRTPGLVSDKLKATLGLVWASLERTPTRGIVLAYDEAQNLSDQAASQQYPLSLLLDVFQSIQKRELPILLVLTGLPTLFPKLVEARTFAERMFHISTLGRLDEAECRDAILKPIHEQKCPVKFTDVAVREITKHSGGYPYFIQFLCREMYDSYLQQRSQGEVNPAVTVEQTVRKLDTDFFAGRWNRVTDRQRDLLSVVAQLPNCDEEFTVQEVVAKSKELLAKPFSPSHVNQMFVALGDNGLVYKNRYGRYAFAVPLLGGFIRRQEHQFKDVDLSGSRAQPEAISLSFKGVWWVRHNNAYPMYVRFELAYRGAAPDVVRRVTLERAGQTVPAEDLERIGRLQSPDLKDVTLKFHPRVTNDEQPTKLTVETLEGKSAEVSFNSAPSAWRPPEMWDHFIPY